MITTLFVVLATEAEYRIEDFNAQDVSNTAWAFTRLGQKNEPLFAALATAAERRMKEFSAQAISNTVWAFAAASRSDEPLFVKLARLGCPVKGYTRVAK